MLEDQASQAGDVKTHPFDDTGKGTYEMVSRVETGGDPSTSQSAQFHVPATSGFRSHLPPSIKRYLFSYKAGLIRSAAIAGLALFLNTSLDAWMFSAFGADFGSGVVVRTRCRTVHALDITLHILLNIISTCILGASNYCMQGISAPTRDEVDALHRKKRWMDIGIQSPKNLAHISPKRVFIWALLGTTSIPFHLFFNSVFFTASQASQYAVAVVSADFFNVTTWSPTLQNTDPALFPLLKGSDPLNLTAYDRQDHGFQIVSLLNDVQNASVRNSNFTKLNAKDCIDTYANTFTQKQSDVVLISRNVNGSAPLFWSRYPQRYLANFHTNSDPSLWICQDFDNENDRCLKSIARDKTNVGKNWTVYDQPINYCLSRDVLDICELQYNVWMMLAIVLFGTFKTATMIWMILQHPIGALRTVGDAIASFLDREDDTTNDMCLVSAATLHREGWHDSFPPQLFSAATHRIRCWHSTKRSTFYRTHALASAFAILLGVCLFFAINGADGSGTAFSSGFNPNIQSLTAIVNDSIHSSTLLPTLLVANIPQVGFSVIYLMYNDLYTHYALAHEWAHFAVRRKGLRVSDMPRGAQRSTRFLSLPARYSVPLMAYSALLHWLLSQSLFLVRIDGVDGNGVIDDDDRISRLGYSTTGIVCVIVGVVGGIAATLAFGAFTWLGSGIVVGSNSALISAAVHPGVEGERRRQMQYQEIMWGDTEGVDREGMEVEVRHVAFTSAMVRPPIEGCVYSGQYEIKKEI